MTVSVVWSASDGGSAITSPLNHGSGSAGANLTEQLIYLHHNGENQIIDCGIYLTELTDTYTGGASKSADLSELIGWGDGSSANSFGGFLLNMDATGSWPTWPTWSSKEGSAYHTIRTNKGDSSVNKILLPIQTGVASIGVIPSGGQPNIRFKCRINIPTNATGVYLRQFDTRLRYTYTS
jgi:hypothetical protein